MYVNRRWIDFLLLILVAAVVILSWTYTLYTTRLTGITYLENRFGVATS